MTLPKTLLIVAALVMVGCSTQKKIARHLKASERHRLQAIALGAPVDTLRKEEIKGEINIPKEITHIEVVTKVDTVKLIEKCKEVVRKPTPKAVRGVQKECFQDFRQVDWDTVYITVANQTYPMLTRTTSWIENGAFRSMRETFPVKIPYTKTVVHTEMRSGDTGWVNFWQYLVAGLIGLGIGFILKPVLRVLRVIP